MDTLMNWLAFTLLIYGLGVGAHRWPGPVVTTRHLMSSRQRNRRSDDDDIDGEGQDDVVSSPVDLDDEGETNEVAPGVFVDSTSRVKKINGTGRMPMGPVPLEQLTGPVDDDSPTDGALSIAEQALERRRWVRARLNPNDSLQLSPSEIDRRGAELFDCTERTIQRDRQRITARRTRTRRHSD